MAKKTRAKGARPRRADDAGPTSETDVEATRERSVGADVERADSKPVNANVASDVEGSDSTLSASMSNVEALEPATPRIDIEHDDGSEAADVERGPP